MLNKKSKVDNNIDYLTFEANLWFRFVTTIMISITIAINYFEGIDNKIIIIFLPIYLIIILWNGFYYKYKVRKLYKLKLENELENELTNTR